MSKYHLIGILLLLLSGHALATGCQKEEASLNAFWHENLRQYLESAKTNRDKAYAVKINDEWRIETDQLIEKQIRKINSLTKEQIPKYLKEFEEGWDDNGASGGVTYLYIVCKAQERFNFLKKSKSRNPQTISSGPVTVTLIPTNSPVSKCYDIQYINRGSKHIDIFIKLTLTNNKTGESGTSVWLGSNTNFDGLFGSANSNRLNPYADAISTRTNMYGAWLMAQNFIFNNQPSNMYGFSDIVESCDDITAEIPAGGLKWNENAYQRHYDAEKKKR